MWRFRLGSPSLKLQEPWWSLLLISMMLSEVMVWKRYFLSRAGLLCTHRDILYRMSWCFKETVGRHVSFDGIMGLDFGSYWNHEPTKDIQRYTKTNLVGSLKSFVLFNDIGVATQKGFQGLVLNPKQGKHWARETFSSRKVLQQRNNQTKTTTFW